MPCAQHLLAASSTVELVLLNAHNQLAGFLAWQALGALVYQQTEHSQTHRACRDGNGDTSPVHMAGSQLAAGTDDARHKQWAPVVVLVLRLLQVHQLLHAWR
jgi:hypothetical protein